MKVVDNAENETITSGVTVTTKEKVNPQIGDYVLYEPDTVSTTYSLLGTQSGKGTYSASTTSDIFSTTPYTFSTPENQSISQESIQWQVLKVHDNGSLDLIGTPTTSTVGFGGWLGYNNGVYLLNDICKELYSNKSMGITARSVSLEDFEDESNGGSWKSARDSYADDFTVQYGKTKTFTDANYSWYPKLYEQENGSGINTDAVKTNGIKETDPYYTTPTTETYGQANSTGLTVTQTDYRIPIDEANYGVTAKVLSNSNGYWIASRSVYADAFEAFSFARFCLRIADHQMYRSDMFDCSGITRRGAFALRPVISLGSSVSYSVKTLGAGGSPNTFEITKY